jgi:hypothetical protein
MDEILATATISNRASLHVAMLSKQTILDAGAEHLGFSGYFVFEVDEAEPAKTLNVLAKTTSLESAFRLIDLWSARAA